MAKILHFETAGPFCSVALGIDGIESAVLEHSEINVHAQEITLLMGRVLQKSNIPLSEIDAIAVSSGPGSYTGLRVGVSAAKGICYALGIPLIGISTLESIASAALDIAQIEDALYIPMIDARRMEVYTAVYSSKLELLMKPQAKVIDETGYGREVTKWGKKVVYCGSGVDKCSSILDQNNAMLYAELKHSASYLVKLAHQKFTQGKFENVAYFKPFYLKSPNITKPKSML